MAQVRFPNESYPIEIKNFKWDEFKVEKEFDNEVFGWYNNVYIAVKKAI